MSYRDGGFFSWVFGKEKETPTKGRTARPAARNMTGDVVANSKMLWGLYHGDYSGLQYASPLVGIPVDTLVNMIGVPTPTCKEDKVTQDALNEITEIMRDRIKDINTTHFVIGTPWAMPGYDSKTDSLVWEDIPDETTVDLFINASTGVLEKLITHELIEKVIKENQNAFYERKRTFDRSTINVEWIGPIPEGEKNYIARNIAGILPIPFPHQRKPGEIRGWSLFARGIRVAKSYHDVLKMQVEILSTFKPKQVQGITDLGEWIKNNIDAGGDPSALEAYDVAGCDLVLNIEGKETTDYKSLPADAVVGYEKAINYLFLLWVQSTGLPQMCWGELATGNTNTVAQDWQRLMTIISAKMRDLTTPYYEIYAASLRLMSIARGVQYKPFVMAWDKLDALSAAVKSQIFLQFAQAVAALIGSAAITPKMLWKLWTLRYPEAEPGEFKEFIAGMSEMVVHKTALGMDYTGAQDFLGAKDDTSPKDGEDSDK